MCSKWRWRLRKLCGAHLRRWSTSTSSSTRRAGETHFPINVINVLERTGALSYVSAPKLLRGTRCPHAPKIAMDTPCLTWICGGLQGCQTASKGDGQPLLPAAALIWQPPPLELQQCRLFVVLREKLTGAKRTGRLEASACHNVKQAHLYESVCFSWQFEGVSVHTKFNEMQ